MLCERVRESVAEAPLVLQGEQVSLTVSVGATLLTDWSSPAETFARADEALYMAKQTRNTVLRARAEALRTMRARCGLWPAPEPILPLR